MPDETEKKRLLSLDVFRGMTIAGMILVNNPGDWGNIYAPLKHAAWHGITPTDFIFPFFLFIVGVAIAFALGKKKEDKVSKEIYLKIIRRSLVIFLLGLLIAAVPYFEFSSLRIPGVLQRIAICYLVASLIFLHTNWKQQAIIGAFFLFLYWFLMTWIPVLGCEGTSINDKACNLSAFIDRMILTENHIWSQAKVFDPEGLLSTIPAIVTTISGVLTGTWLKTEREDKEKVNGIFFFGIVLCAVGWLWALSFPLNKSLWTSSYVVYTSGLALCFLGFCYWLIDIKGYRKWSKPFVIFGVNALALYVGAELLAKALYMINVTGSNGEAIPLKTYIYQNLFLSIASPLNASLLFAITFILFWLFIMWLLYRKQIYIKV